jgi:hypothetical protein
MQNNYIIINSDTIQKRIDELNKIDDREIWEHTELSVLKEIISQSIPLNEELEEAFRNGREGQFYFARDYISNLKLSI